MQRIEKKYIVDLGPECLVNSLYRDSIGEEFSLNDNIDSDIDFSSPEAKKHIQITTKIVGHSSIFICTEGEIDLVCNSIPCKMKKGDVAYAQTGHLGCVNAFSCDARFFLIVCADSFYMPPLTANESAAFRRELATHPIAHLSESVMFGCQMLYKMMRNALYKRDEIHYVRRTVQGLLQSVFFQVFSAYETQAKTDSPLTNARQEEIFQRFIKLVEKNYTQERNIGFYADKLCITPKYLSQLIFKASGIYAGDHIDNYAIAEAKVLIKSRKYTIAQVSDMLNFSSQAYFGRYFKKHTGMTPMEFAEKS